MDFNSAYAILSPYIASDPDILKLYVASHISDCANAAFDEGLPWGEAANIKKDAFERIAKASNPDQLGDICSEAIRLLMQKLDEFDSHNYSDTVQLAIEFIHSEKFKALSVSDVAAQVHMDRSSFSRLFHKETGKTPVDYIHFVKIDTADQLMNNRRYTFTEIADMLGYSSYDYFCRVYQKYRGHAPSLRRRDPQNRT